MTESFSCRYFLGTFLSCTILAIAVVRVSCYFFFFFFIGTFEANFGGILSFSCLGLDTAICPLGIGASFLCSFVFVFAGEKQ